MSNSSEEDSNPFPSDDSSDEGAGGDHDGSWFRTPVPVADFNDFEAVPGRRLKDDERTYRSLMANPGAFELTDEDGAEGARAAPGAPLIGTRTLEGGVLEELAKSSIVAGDGVWHRVVVHQGHKGRGGRDGEGAFYSMGAVRVKGAEHEHGDVGTVERAVEERWKGTAGVMEGFFSKNAARFICVLVSAITDKIGAVRQDGDDPVCAPRTTDNRPYPDDLFDSSVRINLALDEYLRRVVGATKVPSECLLIASMYVDRLWKKAGLQVTESNRHGVALSTVMMASKMFEDVPFAASYWSALSGTFPLAQINEMELYIVKGLAFNLNVKVLAFQEYAKISSL